MPAQYRRRWAVTHWSVEIIALLCVKRCVHDAAFLALKKPSGATLIAEQARHGRERSGCVEQTNPHPTTAPSVTQIALP